LRGGLREGMRDGEEYGYAKEDGWGMVTQIKMLKGRQSLN